MALAAATHYSVREVPYPHDYHIIGWYAAYRFKSSNSMIVILEDPSGPYKDFLPAWKAAMKLAGLKSDVTTTVAVEKPEPPIKPDKPPPPPPLPPVVVVPPVVPVTAVEQRVEELRLLLLESLSRFKIPWSRSGIDYFVRSQFVTLVLRRAVEMYRSRVQ